MTRHDAGASRRWALAVGAWAGLWVLWVLLRHAMRLVLWARLYAEGVWAEWPARIAAWLLAFPSVVVLLLGALWVVHWLDDDPRAVRAAPWLGLAYGLWRGIERQVLSTPVFAQPRRPFDLGFIALGVLVWWLFVRVGALGLSDALQDEARDLATIEPLKEAS